MPTEKLVVIPARMAASRLPGKPLADIAGQPMIVHVFERAREAALGPVVVATDSEDIAAAVRLAGGDAVMTRSDHASGSDRIHEAVNHIDPDGRFEQIINLQGDLPTLDPAGVAACAALLDTPAVDIGTLAAIIRVEEEKSNSNVVKVVGSATDPTATEPARLRALYFTRATAPWGDGALYHHIGIYAYRRASLERFVALPPSPLELRERLEQLRALEAGMRIDVAVVDTVPLGVDTPADLERARAILTR